jgi:hypothetical protein
MKNLWRRFSVLSIAGALVLCGLPGLIGASQTAEAAQAPATPIAKNATEAAFVRQAITSCSLAMAKGFTEIMGKTTVTFKPVKDQSGLYDSANWVATSSDGKPVANPFQFWQPLCFPSDLNAAFASMLKRHDTFYPGLDHKFAKLNNSTYVWTQHLGSADWNAFIYRVKSGLIVGFSGATWQDTKVVYAK